MYKEKILSLFRSPALGDLFRWARPVQTSIILICLLNFILSGSSLVITLTTKGLIDAATSHNSDGLWRNAVLMVIVCVAIRLCSLLLGILRTKTNARLAKSLRQQVFGGLLEKEYSGLSSYHSGELVNRLFSDVGVVQGGIMSIVPQLVGMAVSFFGAAWILIRMDWRFVILLVVGGFLGLFLILLFRKPMSARHKAVQEQEGKLHSSIQETFSNLRIVKASGSEDRMENTVDALQQQLQTTQLKKGYFSVGMNAAIATVFQASWLFCMLWGGLGIYRGVLTYGSLAAIIQLVGQIQAPIASAADIASQIFGTVASAERLKELLDLPDEPQPQAAKTLCYEKLEKIALSHLSFAYDRDIVLDDVSLDLVPGDFVAVTGLSGGGKSTLFSLLLGLYHQQSGDLQFCFTDGACTADRQTRKLFAYVPQGNILFSGTLRENIALFTEDAEDAAIWEAARIACIDSVIASMDEGLGTVIGERGLGLSEGQAQRIAVARAVLSGAPILLLDEATSALDEATEAQMLANIRTLPGKTCLIVTHRRAAMGICDREIHIEDGHLTMR